MWEGIDNFSDDSRVWIYMADRQLTSEEVENISTMLQAFASQWQTHGKKLKSAATVIHDRFLVFMVDGEIQEASGCSIDSSVNLVKKLGAEFDVDFFNRMLVAFRINNQIDFVTLNDIPSKIDSGLISSDTVVFDNTVQSKKEFDQKWESPAADTWLSRYF